MTLKELERRLEEATGERFGTEFQDAMARAIFGPQATFEHWGLVKDALTSIDGAVALCERIMKMLGHSSWTRQMSARYDARGVAHSCEITAPSFECRRWHKCETHAVLLAALATYRALSSGT